MAKEEKALRAALFGFNKKGVQAYVRQLDEEGRRRLEEKDACIQSLQDKVEELQKQLIELSAQAGDQEAVRLAEEAAEELRAENTRREAEAQALRQANDQLRRQLEEAKTVPSQQEDVQMQERLKAQARELETLRETNRQLRQSIEALEEQAGEKSLSQQLEELEREKIRLADVMLKAEAISQKIIDDAVSDSRRQKQALEEALEAKRTKLRQLKDEVEKMGSLFSGIYEKYISPEEKGGNEE